MKNFIEPSVANVYTLDVNEHIERFRIANTSTIAKTLEISNPNKLDAEITVEFMQRAAATITYPASIIWKDTLTPVFTTGKNYFLYFTTYDGGNTYYGTWTGSW